MSWKMVLSTLPLLRPSWDGTSQKLPPSQCNSASYSFYEVAASAVCARRVPGIALMIFETYRSEDRQLALFNQGATKLKNVGVHHYGLACDLVKNINGEPSWKGDFGFLGELADENGMIWGGD
jgi:hypothetical protein